MPKKPQRLHVGDLTVMTLAWGAVLHDRTGRIHDAYVAEPDANVKAAHHAAERANHTMSGVDQAGTVAGVLTLLGTIAVLPFPFLTEGTIGLAACIGVRYAVITSLSRHLQRHARSLPLDHQMITILIDLTLAYDAMPDPPATTMDLVRRMLWDVATDHARPASIASRLAVLAPEITALAHEQQRREHALGPTLTDRDGCTDVPTWSGAFDATVEDLRREREILRQTTDMLPLQIEGRSHNSEDE